MTRFDAETPEKRRALVAEAVLAHRKRDSERTVFETDSTDPPTRIVFGDGQVEFAVDDEERERLTDLLGEFPVFKVAQPETRKAPEETVYVSAITDPKHAADFVDTAFRTVYDLTDDFRVWVVEV
ncbi:hypothetical protein VB773_09040 [Haloarculaceae archaeon H-GB2-1]|nr:hypothetical protein [Haloarculaceae archaeon H-GB1-1]MEA5386190.1 hypothetical protein [Haloarculaceae archaeon H-GB11]MEA5407697.1 hypothetical protein [Haloarculaceae archaeon H-GB2-1]